MEFSPAVWVPIFIGLMIAAGTAYASIASSKAKDENLLQQDRRIDGLEAEMADEKRRCDTKIEDLHRELQELRGKLDVVSGEFLERLSHQLAEKAADRTAERFLKVLRVPNEDEGFG